MQVLKVDRTKCFTPQNYAKKMNVAAKTVYRWIEDKKVPTVLIDGVTFVYVG